MLAVFRKLSPEQQAQLLVKIVSDTEGIVTTGIEENLDEHAYYDEVPGFIERMEMLQQAFMPFNAEHVKDIRVEDLLQGSVDVEAWGGDLERFGGNYIAASAACDNMSYFLATGFYEIDKSYLKHRFVFDPAMLVKENMETFAFRTLLAGAIASEMKYDELDLPEAINFNEVITGWGKYASHSDVFTRFEKDEFDLFLMQTIIETLGVSIELKDDGTVQIR